MYSITFQKLYSKLTRKLLSVRWLERLSIDFNIIEEAIKSNYFIDNLNNIIEDKDYSCSRTLKLCENMLNKISYPNTPENWLIYIYQYTLNKSFPGAVSIILLDSLQPACELYLRVLRILSDAQKISKDKTWQSLYPLFFLNSEEEENLEHPEEYRKFIKAFKHNFTYEMMKLNSEVYGYNTLDHICGVHYLSLFLARQMKSIGLPVDLGRVSGAAAGHDIGKYGCRPSELKRVPYLHYYYSDQWFKHYNINYIRNIALNHSTWDLELENLSLESLILIYSDFRVKNKGSGKNVQMHIFSLKDSFQVIFDKLDNVDEAKEKRYKKVYEKLKDFESFLLSLGIKTELNNEVTPSLLHPYKQNYSLVQGYEIIQSIKFLAIKHNISLMYQLRDEYSLDIILEQARSEKDWKNFREYIRVFQEYSTYLTQNQKLQTIRFLYENLVHPEDDIRRHCAELLGNLIAIYDEDYRKEIPENVRLEAPSVTSFDLLEEYMQLLISPGYKVISAHRFWIGYCMSIMVNSLFKNCQRKFVDGYRRIIMNFFSEGITKNSEIQVFLLETVKDIPLEPLEDSLKTLFSFVMAMLNKHNNTLRLSALEASKELVRKIPEDNFFSLQLKHYLINKSKKSSVPSENLLRYNLAKYLKLEEASLVFFHHCRLDDNKISDIFLSNLKTATDWIKKRNQISLLLQYTLDNVESSGLHTAIHFCNLLKVSAVENVRNTAGAAIFKIMPKLTLAERNEVAIELLRALEIEGNRFTEYIPHYIGQVIMWLQPVELNEIIDDLKIKIKNSSSNVKSLVLKTIGVALSNYTDYKSRFDESEENYNERLISMLGILLNGLGDYQLQVKQTAFSVIGKDIFGTRLLTIEDKSSIFKLIAKKILTMVADTKEEELLFLANSAALNHIYRFISNYTFINGDLNIPIPQNIAFFPGTFDPFSLSHKEIAKFIRDKGFEVYLSLDEFSWSKKTLPNLLRRKIINMSIADELNIFVYPQGMPVNIANPIDLKKLRDSFDGSEVYIAVGSDVILNASSYKLPKSDHSIHNFNHIVFERIKNNKLDEAVKNIDGKIECITLPSKYLEISSTQIRNYIDENRDISSLIDPLAQQYIYENGFYQREPLEKTSIASLWLKIEVVEEIKEDVIEGISHITRINKDKLEDIIGDTLGKPSGRLVLLRDTTNNNEVVGFSMFHWVRSSMLYNELKDTKVSQYIRETSLGRMILIHAIGVKNSDKYKSLEQIIITETLAFCLARDYQFAIFKNMMKTPWSATIYELLELQGCTEISSSNSENPTYVVDMSTPCVLNLDIENILKEPFRSNPKVKASISATRKRLQVAMTKLYPGELVLSFDSKMLHQSMIRKICEENGVPTETVTPKSLGSAMCVPYGDILERYAIPNTVTKALHTEKFFEPSMKDFSIRPYPFYLDLETQVKLIKSFDRPVILVDNILHKGYRMKALDPLLKKEGIKVEKILCGIMSGRGKDLMDIQSREVDSVYFIPRLKLWFNESTLYPFIGGDALWRGNFPERNLLPSINLILPYTSPDFIRNSSYSAIYNLSEICIYNSLDILSVLEDEYHILHERNLNLLNLGQVFTAPRCPDKGKDMDYDLSLSPSHYIKNDLELLTRFTNIFNSFNERSKP
ncbi:cytidyltransferase [Clostridium swellfunianum]|uniref:cytidyltransferase n=1 Tax=Clostridium swellfunianum TaxID=1367462 RepID=UPI00202F1200|nr:cytidyltransferase [Clostridium swellfunianum]MCM0648484.1 cytidyltransferase [Clostridium swellfunianum]